MGMLTRLAAAFGTDWGAVETHSAIPLKGHAGLGELRIANLNSDSAEIKITHALLLTIHEEKGYCKKGQARLDWRL